MLLYIMDGRREKLRLLPSHLEIVGWGIVREVMFHPYEEQIWVKWVLPKIQCTLLLARQMTHHDHIIIFYTTSTLQPHPQSLWQLAYNIYKQMVTFTPHLIISSQPHSFCSYYAQIMCQSLAMHLKSFCIHPNCSKSKMKHETRLMLFWNIS